VIDPDNEYIRLAEAVGGVTIALGVGGVRLNPLDIPPGDRRPQARTYRALFLHTLVSVLLGQQPPPSERAALDKAINAAYDAAGISNDPATWRRQAPLMRDVAAALTEQGSEAAETLAARLTPWTTGSFREMFDGLPPPFRKGRWWRGPPATSPTSCARPACCSPSTLSGAMWTHRRCGRPTRPAGWSSSTRRGRC
jgi:type IV secretory pathway VirB4 component